MIFFIKFTKHLKPVPGKIIYAVLLFIYFISFSASAQTYENQYRQPLDAVLKMIESRFHIKLQYSDDMVKDRVILYAGWRMRSDLKTTLDGILPLNDLVYYKVNDTLYNIEPFRFWQKPVEDGKQQLYNLIASYTTLEEWEKRKADLRKCMLATLRLEKIPTRPPSLPVVTPKRLLNGYSVQNIAIETLPGLFVCGSLYRPLKAKGRSPLVLSPNGHFGGGRYRSDQQYRCATLARMGAIIFTYDLLGWGESRLQFKDEDHYTSTAMTVQTLNSFRILDYLTSLKEVDTSRIGMTGASGGGSQTMLITALSDRIKVTVPVVMLSGHFAGGCPCESGLPIHFCGNGTNNPEIAAMAAPRPQLVISDDQDWTANVPQIEFPYLQKVYEYYGKSAKVKNVHLLNEGHDYGFSKRKAMYAFLAEHLQLDINRIKNTLGEMDESLSSIEEESKLLVFGKNGENLPQRAIKGIESLRTLIDAWLPMIYR